MITEFLYIATTQAMHGFFWGLGFWAPVLMYRMVGHTWSALRPRVVYGPR